MVSPGHTLPNPLTRTLTLILNPTLYPAHLLELRQVVNAIKAREAEIEAANARRAVLTPTRSLNANSRRGSPQKTTFAGGGRRAVVTLPPVRSLALHQNLSICDDRWGHCLARG